MSDTKFILGTQTALQREAQAWVVRLASGGATAVDGQEFRRWCEQSPEHALAFAQAREVWQAMLPAARAIHDDGAAHGMAWNGMPSRPGRRAFLGGALAAGAAYLAVRPPWQLWPALPDLAADYRTSTGEQRRVALAGHVTVEMNTQTRINVRKAEQGVTGMQLLGGEAEVQASAGLSSAFTVLAGSGQVRALAARFNVRHTSDEVCVTCLQGSVELDYAGRSMPVKANWQVTYDARAIGAPRPVNSAEVTAWRQRRLVFNNVPLSQMVDELNRYWPGRLVLTSASLGRNLVQAQFSLDRLSDATALIRDAYGASVTELPGGVLLLSGGET